MEELYTFNSKQLQSIVSQEQKPTKFRKRILSAKTPQIIRTISPDHPQPSDLPRRRTKKKVTFNEGDTEHNHEPPSFEHTHSLQPQEPHSLIITRKQCLPNNYTQPTEQDYSKKDNIFDNPVRRLAKRMFSIVGREKMTSGLAPEEQRRRTEGQRRGEGEKESPGRGRAKSGKYSPKVLVELSNNKLPQAFKGRFGERYLSKVRREESSCEMVESVECVSEIERFKKLLHREGKPKLLNKWSIKSQ